MSNVDATERPAVPGFGIILATQLLAIAGLGVSIYLTIAHFVGSEILACNPNSVINCEIVTTSAQSRFLGIPVAVLGLGYFIVAVPLYSPWAWWSRFRLIHLARIASAVVGMCFVLWLLFAELTIIHKICLWCTSVHVITFILFALTVTSAPAVLGREDLLPKK